VEIMGVLSKLFGSGDTIKKGFDLVDEAFHTSQEKAEDRLKATTAKIGILKAYEGFKLAQRLLAIVVGVPFVGIHVVLFLLWTIIFLTTIYIGGSENYDFAIKQLDMMFDKNNQTLGTPFAWIVGFYFFGGAGEGIVRQMRGVKK
jgi:hypothetical protein